VAQIDKRVHRVPCPTCGAPIGRVCKRPSQHAAWAPHAPRVEAARDAGLLNDAPPPPRHGHYPMCETCGLPDSGRGEPPTCEGCFLEHARHDIALTGPGELYAPILAYAYEENDARAFLSEAELCAVGDHPLVLFFDERTGEPRPDGKGECQACHRTVNA